MGNAIRYTYKYPGGEIVQLHNSSSRLMDLHIVHPAKQPKGNHDILTLFHGCRRKKLTVPSPKLSKEKTHIKSTLFHGCRGYEVVGRLYLHSIRRYSNLVELPVRIQEL